MKKLLFILFILTSVAFAQDKMLSLDEIFDPQTRVPFSGRLMNFRGWTKDGKSFDVFQNGQLMRVDAASGNSTAVYDAKQFVSVLSQSNDFSLDEANAIGQSPNQQFDPAGTSVLLNHRNDLWIYDLTKATVKRLTNNKDEELEADFSPDGKFVSFVRGMNLFVVELATAKEKQLTRDGADKIFNGYLDWVYEEELYGRGNKRGYWWSPDSKSIAFLRTDEAPVPRFPLNDETTREPRVENTLYPKAGDPNPIVTLGVADVKKSSYVPNIGRIPKIGDKLPPSITRLGDGVKFVDLGKYKPDDSLIVRVAWTPDSSGVVFQVQNREQTYLDVNVAFPKDGRTKTIITERTKAWVEAIDNPVYLKDGSSVWQWERNGFRHLYRHNNNGDVMRQITDGRWEVTDFYGVDETNGFAYFSAIGVENDWVNTHIYRARLDGSELRRLTDGFGTHRAVFNPTFTHFVDYWSETATPPQMKLVAADGSLVRMLDDNRVPILDAYKLGRTQFLKVKTRDGFEMESMMILPPDFNTQKRYPVMAYTYSGPHAPQVRNRWLGSRGMWFQMLAQKGYIVWICDNRTASGKGAESTWTAYKQFGRTEVNDLEDGFAYLKSLAFVDGSRLGMFGWSYGGFMTSYFMTQSKTLKIGIAGGTVADWSLYDSIYTERYMRQPRNNVDGYRQSSVIANAGNLSGRLLLIHGLMDDNVHAQNATQLIYALQKAGKTFDFMPYPTQRHGVQPGTAQEEHLYRTMTEFIEKNL